MKNIDRKKKDEFPPGSESNLIDKNGVTDSQKVENIPIDRIEPIISVNFKDDDIDRISKSIKEIGYEPVIVRPEGNGKYQLCSHPEIFEALKFLGEEKIDCVIQDISEQQGKELNVASLLRNPEISTKEHEYIVWDLFKTGYETGKYKSKADCARKIGIPDTLVSYLCYGKEQREKLFGPDGPSGHISTDTLRFIKVLPDDEQKLFCERIKDKKILPSDVHDAVIFLNNKSKDFKNAILDGDLPWKDARDAIEKGYAAVKKLLDKIQNDYEDPRKLQKIVEKEIPYFSSELFRDFANFLKELDVAYFDNIKDELEKKQADNEENICYALLTYYMLKRGKINQTLYNNILKTLNLDADIVEHLKEDGSLPHFQVEP